MEAPNTEATPNAFEGQGGCFYINPKGSGVLKRDRDFDVPFDALSKAEKHARLLALPADRISDRDRAARIGGLGLTADDIKQARIATSATSAASQTIADAAPVTQKSKGAK